MRTLAAVAVPVLLLVVASLQADPLVVHEWGTFTSLQDEHGRTIGGINTDDEPVPQFVHTVHRGLLLLATDLPNLLVKGYPQLHPDVTMRLETPVMYFYPPDGQTFELTVRVAFRGGWLTEFYPEAEVDAPGLLHELPGGGIVFGGIDGQTRGELTWRNLRIGVSGDGPQTEEEVWLAPRRVRAALVGMPNGETEKYLFYRGVGHLDAPLRTVQSEGWIEVGTGESALRFSGHFVDEAWLADIRNDGTCAFRRVGSIALGGPAVTVSSHFAASEYSERNLERLRQNMHEALVDEGLFADEAKAMLDTWEAAYFESAGLRLFYTVPQVWTDHVLPLEFSQQVDLTRVMIGRIELVTPRQRRLLSRISSAPVELFPIAGVNDAINREMAGDQDYLRKLLSGRLSLLDLGVDDVPESYLAYRDLGRLRNALVLDELTERPTPELQLFVNTYRLAGHSPPSSAAAAGAVPDPAATTSVISDAWEGRGDDGRAVASGVYIYRLETPSATRTRKLLLLR